jgi:hypothetical protein
LLTVQHFYNKKAYIRLLKVAQKIFAENLATVPKHKRQTSAQIAGRLKLRVKP